MQTSSNRSSAAATFFLLRGASSEHGVLLGQVVLLDVLVAGNCVDELSIFCLKPDGLLKKLFLGGMRRPWKAPWMTPWPSMKMTRTTMKRRMATKHACAS